MKLTADQIKQYLTTQTELPADNPYPAELLSSQLTRAAVLIPVFQTGQEWNLLLIHRAEHTQGNHSGQVAFPGGCQESSDANLEETALREVEEEIGLDRHDVQILGKLQDFVSISNFLITPYVGLIPWPCHLEVDTREVRHAFTAPLTWLADRNNIEMRQREISSEHPPIDVIYYRDYQGEQLWGATARITLSFIDLLQEQKESTI